MDLIQTLRRLGQQNAGGWSHSGAMQAAQLPLIKKLYEQNGLEIKLTCGACPEQYEIFKDGEQVAYYRLRHGEFTVDVPDCGGETIYEAEPNGDGTFDENERIAYLARAMRKLIQNLPNEKL